MPLRGRVGRRNSGANCQNWKRDQEHVIALLNRIPAADGGAGGSLTGRVFGGVASDALYLHILLFQQKHFPQRQTGYVEPGSPVLAKMEMLAARPSPPPPPPKPPGQWDAIKSRSVDRALSRALENDLQLSHAEVVNIVRSTLSDGTVAAAEVKDLREIAHVARTISPRSKKLLNMVADKIEGIFGSGPYRLRSDRHDFAAEMICDFLKRSGSRRFPKLDRDEVGVGMLMRIAAPGILRQDEGSLCGPAALLFSLASDRPVQYASTAIDLYEHGKARLGRLEIAPGEDVRNFKPPASMDHVDWLTMASIRDSENWFLDYDSVSQYKGGLQGITLPGELTRWFKRAGYRDVREETNLWFSKDTGNVDKANRLFGQGYRLCLFISSNMLYEKRQSEEGAVDTMHWVVQRSPIDRSNGKVRLKVFTWGQGERQVPQGAKDLSVGDFLENFYGYVAGRP